MQHGDGNDRTRYENSSRQFPHFTHTLIFGDVVIEVVFKCIFCSQVVRFFGIYASFYIRGEYIDTSLASRASYGDCVHLQKDKRGLSDCNLS